MGHQVRLLVQFDGTAFHGWQAQAGLRTVQGVLTQAVETMLHHRVCLRASSRTDAGVHALALPVTLRTPRDIPERGMMLGLNALLPADVSVVDVRRVPDDFHVRRSARGKTYRYWIWNAPYRSALRARYTWHMPACLDLEAMRAAATHLLGEHDFSAFRAAHCDSHSVHRFVERIDVTQPEPHLVEVRITANAFLRNMARIMAGTLVEVGLGRFTAASVADILASRDRTRAGRTAPACGLTLVEVRYP